MFSEAENNTMQKTPTPTKTLTRHQQETRNFQFNSVLWCQAPPTRPSFKLVFGKHMLGWTSFFLTTNLCMRFLHHGSSIAFVPFFLSFSIFFSLLIVLKLSAHTPGHLHVYACMHRHFMSASLKPRSANVLDQSFCNWMKIHFSQKTTIFCNWIKIRSSQNRHLWHHHNSFLVCLLHFSCTGYALYRTKHAWMNTRLYGVYNKAATPY